MKSIFNAIKKLSGVHNRVGDMWLKSLELFYQRHWFNKGNEGKGCWY